MRPIDADRLLSESMKSKYYHLKNGDIAVPIIDIEHAPTVELVQKPIDYADCSNAMLKMWMENVLTDGEYSRIMDKLNKAHEDGKL